MERIDLAMVLYIIIFFIVLSSSFGFRPLLADEGTHLLLSIFYRDLIQNSLSNGFSFDSMYNFGMNYLAHYPKLQIAYPPLYHLSNVLAFFVFGATEFAGRLVSLIYASLSIGLIYLIVRRLFNKRLGFVTAVLFSLSPFSIFFASGAYQDFTTIFWVLLSSMIYLNAMEKEKTIYFAAAGFTAFLAAMGKQMAAFLIVFFAIHMIWKLSHSIRKRYYLKSLAVLLLLFIIPLTPYLLVMQKVGGFEINKMVAIDYAIDQGEPVSPLNPIFWLYYIIVPAQIMPLFLVMIFALFFYTYQKKPYSRHMLGFFFVFYILLSLIPNKEPRFSQFFLLPTYPATAYFLIRDKRVLLGFFAVFIVFSANFLAPTFGYYPSADVAAKVYGGNVAMFSERDPIYSSVLMWHIRNLDKNMSFAVYRKCLFENKTDADIKRLLEWNNVKFVVKVRGDDDIKIIEGMELVNTVQANHVITEIYRFTGSPTGSKKLCNYICLTKKEICV